jgi:hypothetical protein
MGHCSRKRVADNGGTEKIHQVRRGQEQIRLSEDIVKMKKRLKKAANTGDLQDSLTYILLVMCVDILPNVQTTTISKW